MSWRFFPSWPSLPLSIIAAMQLVLSSDWRRWLIENIVDGVPPQRLERALMKGGLSRAAARRALASQLDDPRLLGGFRAAAMQRKLEGLMDVYAVLYRQSPRHRE